MAKFDKEKEWLLNRMRELVANCKPRYSLDPHDDNDDLSDLETYGMTTNDYNKERV